MCHAAVVWACHSSETLPGPTVLAKPLRCSPQNQGSCILGSCQHCTLSLLHTPAQMWFLLLLVGYGIEPWLLAVP